MTDDETDFLHRAAFDALANMSGTRGEADLIALLRSGVPIEQNIRDMMADALEAGRLRIHRGGHGRSGRPRPANERIASLFEAIEIGRYYIERITPSGNEKAALADTCAAFGISEKTARAYRDRAKAWIAAQQEFRRPLGT